MATVQSNMFEQIQQELSCSICLELFTRPKVLPCQHTFCQDCLQDHAERQGTFQCPNCRQQLDLPQQGVASLPTNNIVANLCNTLRKRKTEKDHANIKCPDHQSKDINLYCNRCQVPVCVECLGENHKGHRTTNLTAAAQEKKPSAEKLIAEARNLMKIYSDVLQGVRNKETSLTELKQQRDEELDTALAQAVQHLKESKASLKSQADQEHAKNVKDLQTQKNEALEKFAEISSACIAAMKGVEKGGVELLHTEASLLKVVGKSVPTPKSVQTVEFQPTDPKTLTLGQFSSCRKQSWPRRTITNLLCLPLAFILAILCLFLLMGGVEYMYVMGYSIISREVQNYMIDRKVLVSFVHSTFIGIFFSISCYWFVYQGKLRFFSSSLLSFVSWFCLLMWAHREMFYKVDMNLYAGDVSAVAILSCYMITVFIWINN